MQGFIKNRYIARTFIMPGQEMRKKTVRLKLNTIKSEFKDKVLAKVFVLKELIAYSTVYCLTYYRYVHCDMLPV